MYQLTREEAKTLFESGWLENRCRRHERLWLQIHQTHTCYPGYLFNEDIEALLPDGIDIEEIVWFLRREYRLTEQDAIATLRRVPTRILPISQIEAEWNRMHDLSKLRKERNMSQPLYPDIVVELTACDANAYSIIAKVRKALRNHNVSPDEVDAFLDDVRSGDYDHLLQTCFKWVTVR